jgi:ubiquinone/menaquinone biosynthesis C-methylase UbiE
MKSNRKIWKENLKIYNYWDDQKARKTQKLEADRIWKWLKNSKFKNFNILEIGCGNGYLAQVLISKLLENNKKFKYLLTDLISECLKYSEKKCSFTSNKNVSFGQLDVYKISKKYKRDSQQIIISTGFASAASYKKAVPEISKVLKKNGILICDFINHLSPLVFLPSLLKSPISLIRKINSINNPSSKNYHFGIVGIEKYFLKHNLKLIKVKYIGLMDNPILILFKKI